MRCVRWWLRRWRPDLVPHGAALGASGPSPGRTTRRQLVVARSGAGSLHGPRWGRQVPAAAALVPAALAAAGHGEAEHQDEQDRGDDEQDAPHGPPPCPYLHLCAGEPGAPKLFPASAFGSKLLRSRALWRSRLALSSNAPAGQRDQPHTHRVAEPWRCVGRCAHLAAPGRYSPGSNWMTKSTVPLLSRADAPHTDRSVRCRMTGTG
jgi:hypothetical protein